MNFDRADAALVLRWVITGLLGAAAVFWTAFVVAIAGRHAWAILTGGGC